MTIVKIHNPVLRFAAGLAMLAVIVAAVVGISYGVGYLTAGDEARFCSFGELLISGFVVGGASTVAVALVGLLAYAIGSDLTRNPVLQILAGLGILAGGAVAVLASCYGLGWLTAPIWARLIVGPIPYAACGFLTLVALGVVALALKTGHDLGERHFDP